MHDFQCLENVTKLLFSIDVVLFGRNNRYYKLVLPAHGKVTKTAMLEDKILASDRVVTRQRAFRSSM